MLFEFSIFPLYKRCFQDIVSAKQRPAIIVVLDLGVKISERRESPWYLMGRPLHLTMVTKRKKQNGRDRN